MRINPYNRTTKELLVFILWSDLITLGHGLWLHVFCSFFASVPSVPLPGAFDRSLGAVFYLMAHTVSRITSAIMSLWTRLPRRSWDTGNTLLANRTWGSHLTVAWRAWDTWRQKRSRWMQWLWHCHWTGTKEVWYVINGHQEFILTNRGNVTQKELLIAYKYILFIHQCSC